MTIMTVHMQCVISCWKLWSRAALSITCSQHVLPFPCQTYWLKLVVLNVARVLVSVLFFSLHLLHCLSLPSFQLCLSKWPAYHLYLEICFLSELGENMSCGVLSQPAFSKILLLPLVVVTGIFLKNKSLHFSYQEYLWAESMQWRSFTEPCPCLWYVFFPLLGFCCSWC